LLEYARRQAMEQAILRVITTIPHGRVASYGQAARLAGHPRQARCVGRLLVTAPPGLPWHRIVNAQGRSSLPPGSAARAQQLSLLQAEGLALLDGRIELAVYGYRPRSGAPLLG
jgi:methylated-DNA-protein-cysteine methyltransferase-like protein